MCGDMNYFIIFRAGTVEGIKFPVSTKLSECNKFQMVMDDYLRYYEKTLI